MNNENDFYSAVQQFPITYTANAASYDKGTSIPNALTIGYLQCWYTVRVTDNVSNLNYLRSYTISCRQRFVLNNPTNATIDSPLSIQSGGLGIIPNSGSNTSNLSDLAAMSGLSSNSSGDYSDYIAYLFYPVWAMCSNLLQLTADSPAANQTWLLDYRPRTINSTVNASSSSGIGASGGSSQSYSNSMQKTVGSSNSTAQNYDVSLSIGNLSGISASASAGWSNSHSTDRSRSRTSGSDSSTQRDASSQTGYNDTMTIKDWGIFSSIDVTQTIPSCTWFLAQEFPYNFLQTNAETAYSSTFPYPLILQPTDLANVFPVVFSDGGTEVSYNITPPAELSLFGVDFALMSIWQIDMPPQTSAPAIVVPSHIVDAIFASHYSSATQNTIGIVEIVGQLNPSQSTIYTGPNLDLSLLALDPIRERGGSNGAVIGFLPDKFLVPISTGNLSRSVSTANNLMVLTQGFNAPAASGPANNAVLNASITSSTSAQINVCFKMASFVGDLNLYLKHWVGSDQQACTLSVWFNPSNYAPTDTGSPQDAGGNAISPDLEFLVNTMEGAGGDNNLLVVNIRNTFYDSINYHDYLLPGLNVIVIVVNSSDQSSYFLRTVAIGA